MKTIVKGIINALKYIFYMFFRHFNFPATCGLYKIGKPDENSPVFLSGNFVYTVNWLKKVLKGIDCYILVADSSGSNVWCAAGMNEFSEHDVIDAINVAKLDELVKHRKIIAPPYAAPGVDVQAVKKETGFKISWGPVNLKDIPKYVDNNYKRTNKMLHVDFGLKHRIELALATSLAYTLTSILVLIFFPKFLLGSIIMIFCVNIVSFVFWPVLPPERLFLRTLTMIVISQGILYGFFYFQSGIHQINLPWHLILLGIVLFSSMDHCGTTAVKKTTIWHWLTHGNYDSLFNPVIDPELCKYCLDCISVCPKNVFAKLSTKKKIVAVNPKNCEECLACVKQCRYNAIYNRNKCKLKDDVKSIPNLKSLMARNIDHLKDEKRWIKVKTSVQDEFLVVDPEVETKLSR